VSRLENRIFRGLDLVDDLCCAVRKRNRVLNGIIAFGSVMSCSTCDATDQSSR
jgi:hypothetical protein